MDGCKNPDDSKLASSIKRHKNELEYSSEVLTNDCEKPQNEIFPLLMGSEFDRSLRRNNIIRKAINFEADNHIAKLANYFDCYILSKDSDFYVTNLKRGVILMDLFDYKKQGIEGEKKFLTVQVFNSTQFIKLFPWLNPDLIALGGVLLGNDYIKIEKVEKSWSGTHKYQNPFGGKTKYRVFDVFSYLNCIRDFDEVVRRLKITFPCEKSLFDGRLELCINEYVRTEYPDGTLIDDNLSNFHDSSIVATRSGKSLSGKLNTFKFSKV